MAAKKKREAPTVVKTVAQKVPIDLQTYLNQTMKEYTLTVQERDAATTLFNEFKGSLSQMVQLSEDVKSVLITPEELAKAEKIPVGKNEKGDDVFNYKWEGESDKKVMLSVASVEYLRGKIKERSDANNITFADFGLVSLDKKLSE